MSLILKSQSLTKQWDYSEDNWLLQGGNSSQRKSDGKVVSFDCQIYLIDEVDSEVETFVGTANGHLENDVLKTNINGLTISQLAEISHIIDNLIAAIEAVDA